VDHLTSLFDELRTEGASKVEQLVRTHEEEVQQLFAEREEIEDAVHKGDSQRDVLELRLYDAEEARSSARTEREQLINDKNTLSAACTHARMNCWN
jgi:chromosome segregation ATPase